MTEARIKVRANKSAGELEIEGSPQAVAEWWEKLWPEVSHQAGAALGHGNALGSQTSVPTMPLFIAASGTQVPDLFGEYFTEFKSDITDVDKVLVAAAFIQSREQERVFTTKAANQALLDQNIKVANASENVRRLIQTKRVFVVSGGKYRVSAGGLEHLISLRVSA